MKTIYIAPDLIEELHEMISWYIDLTRAYKNSLPTCPALAIALYKLKDAEDMLQMLPRTHGRADSREVTVELLNDCRELAYQTWYYFMDNTQKAQKAPNAEWGIYWTGKGKRSETLRGRILSTAERSSNESQ